MRDNHQYYLENKEHIKAKVKQYQKNNKDKIAKYKKEYSKKNRRKLNEYLKIYKDKNKERFLQRYNEWRIKNKHILNQSRKNRRKSNRDKLIKLLGNECTKCHTILDLQIDHIYGGGKYEEKSRFNNESRSMWYYYLNHEDEAKQKLQILCSKHNREKQILNKESGRRYREKWNNYY